MAGWCGRLVWEVSTEVAAGVAAVVDGFAPHLEPSPLEADLIQLLHPTEVDGGVATDDARTVGGVKVALFLLELSDEINLRRGGGGGRAGWGGDG